MSDLDAGRQESTEAQQRRVRWWFPAMFGVSAIAAVIAVIAWVQRDGTEPGPVVPDLSSLGGASPGVDDPAPDFSVTTFDGTVFSLVDHLATDGRPVVLNLWASWCVPCRAEMPAFDASATNGVVEAFVAACSLMLARSRLRRSQSDAACGNLLSSRRY